MNLGELIEEFRIVADDNQEPPLWSDNELRIYFNQAEKEACRRARLIIDSSTAATCEVASVIGQADYTIDSRVISIRRATVPSKSNRKLAVVKAELMDGFMPNWEAQSGSPDALVVGLNSKKIRLFRKPTEVFTIQLTVVRTPLTAMTNPNDEPEIPERYHQGLINWALYRAYSKKDVETNDEQRALMHLRAFEAEFGTHEQASALEEEFLFNQSQLFNVGAR